MAKVITVDQKVTEVEPENGTDFTYEELCKHTKSEMVQMVVLQDGRYMWMDENGKLEGKVSNSLATTLLKEAGGIPWDYVAGDVLICERDQVK